MKKKETAVQWLIKQLESNYAIGYNSVTKQQQEKALQMERERLEEAYSEGQFDVTITKTNDASSYYTETFNT